MNDLNNMPPKCQDCPYWEWAERPYFCDCKERYENNILPNNSQSNEKDNMLTYYSMAITDKGTQFYYRTDSAEKALNQFEVWDNEYGVIFKSTWIDVYDSGKKVKRLSVAQKWVLESEDDIT